MREDKLDNRLRKQVSRGDREDENLTGDEVFCNSLYTWNR